MAPALINVDEVIEAFNAAHPDVVQEAAPARQPAVAPPQPQPGQEQPQVNAVLPQQEQIIPPQGQIIEYLSRLRLVCLPEHFLCEENLCVRQKHLYSLCETRQFILCVRKSLCETATFIISV